jgi:hypothetical protein
MTTPEEMLKQVCNNYFAPYTSLDELFVIDRSVPMAIAESLHPMPAEMAATLDCWRDKMIAAIEEVVLRYKKISTVEAYMAMMREWREELDRVVRG